MARERLTDEERDIRRKARSAHSFSNAAYNHYDTTQGHGSAEEWVRAADKFSEGRGSLNHVKARLTKHEQDLEIFGLTGLPETIAMLKKAFRNAMFLYHPDHGGTNAQAQSALAAFDRLKEFY